MKVENFFDTYLSGYQSDKDDWNYEDGCVLLGASQMYQATGDEKYVNFIEQYLKNLILEDGIIRGHHMDEKSLEDVNCAKILSFMYERTGEEKYRKAMELVMDDLRRQPRCACGNFFYKQDYPYQIWLDALYMVQPFYMEYETKYDKKEKYNDIISQFENVQKYLYDEKTGLCYHVYDEKTKQIVTDDETGDSKHFLLRSMGLYLMALVDVMEHTSIEIYEQYRKLQDIFKLVLKGILQYQDEKNGLFYRGINRADVPENAIDISGSAMVAYSILKACRMGILLNEKYAPTGMEMMERLMSENLTEVTASDAAGVGSFMMAYAQYLLLQKEMEV